MSAHEWLDAARAEAELRYADRPSDFTCPIEALMQQARAAFVKGAEWAADRPSVTDDAREPACPDCGSTWAIPTSPTLGGNPVNLCGGCHRVSLVTDWIIRGVADSHGRPERECGRATSAYVTDEMVETAARAYHEAVAGTWDVSTPLIHERGRVRARAALEAVAPLIAAAAWGEGYAAAQLEWEHVYDGHTIDPDVDDPMCTECGKGNPYE